MKKNKSLNQIVNKQFHIKQKAIGDDMIVTMSGGGFWNVDSDNDMILPWAYDKSIEKRGPNSSANAKIAFCWQHDLRTPIGRFKSLTPNNDNLEAVAEFDPIPFVKETVIPQVNSGTLNNTSIGYRYTENCKWMSSKEILDTYGDQMPAQKRLDLINSYGRENESKDIFVCQELRLHEISIVTIGANDDTAIYGGKSIEEISEQFDKEVEEIKGLLVGLTTDNQYTALQGLEKLQGMKDHFSSKHAKKESEKPNEKTVIDQVFTIDLEPKIHKIKF